MTAQIIPFPVRRIEPEERAAYDQLAQERPELIKLAEILYARARRVGKKTSRYECLLACKVSIDMARES